MGSGRKITSPDLGINAWSPGQAVSALASQVPNMNNKQVITVAGAAAGTICGDDIYQWVQDSAAVAGA